MLIRVVYGDGRFDMVKPNMLDLLLKQKTVTRFKRSDGWAVVGRDAIRAQNHTNFHGEEKRQKE